MDPTFSLRGKQQLLTSQVLTVPYTLGALNRRPFHRYLIEAEAYCLRERKTYICREERRLIGSRFTLATEGFAHHVLIDRMEKSFGDG